MAEPLPLYVTSVRTALDRLEELATRAPETAWVTLLEIFASCQDTYDRLRAAYPDVYRRVVADSIQQATADHPEVAPELAAMRDRLAALSDTAPSPDRNAQLVQLLDTLAALGHAVADADKG